MVRSKSTRSTGAVFALQHNRIKAGLQSEGICAPGTPTVLPLQNAISLLRLCISGINADLSDITITVSIAMQRLQEWTQKFGLDQPEELETHRIYPALDVLALVESVLDAELKPATAGLTVNPVCGALELAVELLQGLIRNLQAAAAQP